MTRNVLILGATSAIAAEVAKLYAAAGDRLFLVGRTPAKLDSLVAELGDAVVGHRACDLDVLDQNAAENVLHGEIITSADTAARVAAEIMISEADELLLYVVHGMLHLVGYGDNSSEQRIAMRAAEQKYMALAGAEYSEPNEDRP